MRTKNLFVTSLGEVLGKNNEIILGSISVKDQKRGEEYQYDLLTDAEPFKERTWRVLLRDLALKQEYESFVLTMWNIQRFNNQFTRTYGWIDSKDRQFCVLVCEFEADVDNEEAWREIRFRTASSDMDELTTMCIEDNKKHVEVRWFIPKMEYGLVLQKHEEIQKTLCDVFKLYGLGVI